MSQHCERLMVDNGHLEIFLSICSIACSISMSQHGQSLMVDNGNLARFLHLFPLT